MDSRPASVLLVDGHSLIHRAFHALPPLSVGGVFTNAVQGFFAMLFKAIADYRPEISTAIDSPAFSDIAESSVIRRSPSSPLLTSARRSEPGSRYRRGASRGCRDWRGPPPVAPSAP